MITRRHLGKSVAYTVSTDEEARQFHTNMRTLRENEVRKAYRMAKEMRDHIANLKVLVKARAGQPLFKREQTQAPAERVQKTFNTTRDAYRAANDYPKDEGWKTMVRRTRNGYVTLTATRAAR